MLFEEPMPAIDPTTPIGKVRLRIADWQDIPILPDSVIQSTLDDNSGNVYRAASICAQYILGILSSKTHKRLSQLETWSGEQFSNYLKFLQTTILNPHLAPIAPIPYSGVANDSDGDLQRFIEDWKNGYKAGAVVISPQTPGGVTEYEYGI